MFLLNNIQQHKYIKPSLILTTSFVLALLIIVGCDKKEPDVLKPTFSSIYENIFSKKCAQYTCHSSAFAKESGELDLMKETSYSSLVNVKSVTFPEILRIKPGDPDNSLLINRLDGTIIVAPPLERTSVSENELKIIRTWIKNGALNN